MNKLRYLFLIISHTPPRIKFARVLGYSAIAALALDNSVLRTGCTDPATRYRYLIRTHRKYAAIQLEATTQARQARSQTMQE